MHNLKQTIQHCLDVNDLDSIVSFAKKNRRVFAILIRSAYEKDTLAAWRAIKAVGLVAKAIVSTDYEFLRETARKLLWSVSDESGSIGWSAPEMLGEIVSADPERFRDLIPLIAAIYEIEEEVFRPGVLYALGKIAEAAPELVVPYQEILGKALRDAEPIVRACGLELLKKLKSLWENRNLMDSVKALASDQAEAIIFRNGVFVRPEIRDLACGLLLISKKSIS